MAGANLQRRHMLGSMGAKGEVVESSSSSPPALYSCDERDNQDPGLGKKTTDSKKRRGRVERKSNFRPT